MAWLLIVALVLGTSAATFVNSLGNIIRTRESTDVFSPSLDTFQNLAAGRKTFCMERLGVCNTMSCEYCRCWNTSDVFMSYNIGCINSMQLTSDIQSKFKVSLFLVKGAQWCKSCQKVHASICLTTVVFFIPFIIKIR